MYLFLILMYWYKINYQCRLGFLRIQGIVHFMAFYVFKAASEGTKLAAALRSFKEELLPFSHVFPFSVFYCFEIIFMQNKKLSRPEFSISLTTVVRGEKTRKEYAVLLRRHRAAVIIQKQIKGRNARKTFKNISDASIVIQSGKYLVYFPRF